MARVRNKQGQFILTDDPKKDAEKREKEVQHQLGYTYKKPRDMVDDMIYEMERAGLITSSTEITPLGFTKEFFNDFLKLDNQARNYKHDLPLDVVAGLEGDTASYFTPIDDFYSTPGGGDTVYDYGRVPVNHLMTLASQRLGAVWRACNGIAGDVFRNRFEFVKIDNPEKVVNRGEIKDWMDYSGFWDKMTDVLDFDNRTGLGHLVAYYPGQKDTANMNKKAPNTRPNKFESFSAYYMTPTNIYESRMLLDYDKQMWDFIGGLRGVPIHRSRVYPLETRRAEGALRGWSLPELAWTADMCYLNTMYYVLKGLSTLGTVMASIHTEKEYPTPVETAAYLAQWKVMKANKIFILGKNATFQLENAAAKIGSGIQSYLEFIKEDMSAAWIFPKNQMFGRAEGGGLEGAGALISKEDYLASNISVKQLQITNDIMKILKDMCGYPNLEKVTLRWNIDLHKSEEQRLKEQMMREQVEVAKINTAHVKLQHKLYKQQVKLQLEMNNVQLKMIKSQPEKFLGTTQKDEENLKAKEAENEGQVGNKKQLENKAQAKAQTKGDFLTLDYLQIRYNKLKEMFIQNQQLLEQLKQGVGNNA